MSRNIKFGRFSLPDGWSKYHAVGDVIPGTRFIAFKVPLMLPYFDGKNLEGEMFTTTQLCQQLGHKLRLVIDLSCKTVGGYYNPQDLERNGIRYVKLAVPGHVIPSQQIMERFRHIVEDFERSNPSDCFIGVHCTHGVNRTGYVISRYMVEHLNKTTEEALEAFEAGRGYPLERENYIQALRNFEKSRNDALKPVGNNYHTRGRKDNRSRNNTRPKNYYYNNWNGDGHYDRGFNSVHSDYEYNHCGNQTSSYEAQHQYYESRPDRLHGTQQRNHYYHDQGRSRRTHFKFSQYDD